jgi:hypothetical protein
MLYIYFALKLIEGLKLSDYTQLKKSLLSRKLTGKTKPSVKTKTKKVKKHKEKVKKKWRFTMRNED